MVKDMVPEISAGYQMDEGFAGTLMSLRQQKKAGLRKAWAEPFQLCESKRTS